MKQRVCFGIVHLLIFTGCGGSNNSTVYVLNVDSVAVLPISGDLWREPGLKTNERLVQEFLQSDFPEQVASAIAKNTKIKVIPPAIVQEKQVPTISIADLAKAVGAKAVLVGKASPETPMVAFELLVADTGKLLWGASYRMTAETPKDQKEWTKFVDQLSANVVSSLMEQGSTTQPLLRK